MSTNTRDAPGPVEFLRPLQKRARTDQVTAQLREMSRLSRSAVLRRAAAANKGNGLERETLVALIRAYRRAGDADAADQILGNLVRRQRPAIQARVRAWRTLAAVDHEDAESQGVLKLMEYVNSLEPGEELWECNFTGSFNFRMISLLKGMAARRVPTVSSSVESAHGEEWDRLEALPDFASAARFSGVEVRDMIAALSGSNPQIGEFLYLSFTGMADAEIGVRLGVSDRTLRNWKTRLRAAFEREWRD